MDTSKTTSTRFLLLLGLPSFGLTFGVTILTAYLPVVLHRLIDPILIGLVIGAEGFFGLFLPLIFGVLSDRSRTVRGRWVYLLPATAAICAALVLMGLLRYIWIIVPMVALFYAGYFAYLAPYWATYPDLIPKSHSGRSRSAESIWRVVGAFIALISGGFLLSIWVALPFIVGAGLVAGVTFAFGYVLRGYYRVPIQRSNITIKESLAYIWGTIRRRPNILNLLIANAFWNAALQSIQAFVVLFFTDGLGRSPSFVSGLIFPIAAIGLVIMAPLSGKLADRYGHYPVLLVASLIYGVGALLPTFTLSSWVIFCVPLVAGAAATVMTLPYSALMRLIKHEPHGAVSGLFGISRGLGTFLGPLLSGVAVVAFRPVFQGSHGWSGMWLAVGLFILISILFLMRVEHEAI